MDFQNNTNDDTWQHIEHPTTSSEDTILSTQSPTSVERLVISTASTSDTSKPVERIAELYYRVALLEEQLCDSTSKAHTLDQHIARQSNEIIQLTNRMNIAENKIHTNESATNIDVTSVDATGADTLQNSSCTSLFDRVSNLEQMLSIQSIQTRLSALEDSCVTTDLLNQTHGNSQENINHTETRIHEYVNQKFDELYRDLKSRDEHYSKVDATLRGIISSMTNLTKEFGNLQVLVYEHDDKLES